MTDQKDKGYEFSLGEEVFDPHVGDGYIGKVIRLRPLTVRWPRGDHSQPGSPPYESILRPLNPRAPISPPQREDIQLSDGRIEVLASKAGGHYVGAPATREEECAMAREIQSARAQQVDSRRIESDLERHLTIRIAAISTFCRIQDEFLELHKDTDTKVPAEWINAYRALRTFARPDAASASEQRPVEGVPARGCMRCGKPALPDRAHCSDACFKIAIGDAEPGRGEVTK